MKSDFDPVFDIALSVADGDPTEWSTVPSDDVMPHLKELEKIAAFHRSLDQPAGTRRWGRLVLREVLGSGTRGEVWRAWDPELRREIAVKMLPVVKAGRPEIVEALIREGELTARVRHENVVTIFGVAHHDGAVGLSMELIEGKTYSELVKEQGPLGPQEAALVGARLCEALAAIHAAGLIHGDIKAQNVMRQVGGRIVLMDLSSGSRQTATPQFDALPATSGTPLYMAPEVLEGGSPTPQSDIYSLGVLLYYLVTGRFPVEATTLEELRRTLRTGRRTLLMDARQDVPRPFAAAVESALEMDPTRRPMSAGQFEGLLRGVQGPQPRPRARQFAWAIGGLFAVVLTLLGARFWWVHRPYQVEVQMLRTNNDGVADVLTQGSAVTEGDGVHLEFRSDRRVWLYVVNEDEAGHLFVLSGIPGLRDMGFQNPVNGGVTTRVPIDRDGKGTSWVLDRVGGTEHFLLVASPDRLDDLEARLSRLAQPQEISAARERLRGFGGIAGPGNAMGSVAETFDQLTAEASSARGVWTRRIDLIGPKH
jgi:hypothetical protein